MKPCPVAWMVYTRDGRSCYVTDNPADVMPDQRALPLYTESFPTDEALLRQASEMLATMPVKHPQQGQERDALLEVIKERLK